MRFNRNVLFSTSMWAMIAMYIVAHLYFYPALPERVAIHFNALGQPDGWAPKHVSLWVSVVLLLFLAATFQFLLFYFPKKPEDLINIPNKNYWLSAENRTFTIRKVRNYLNWIANLTVLFLCGVFYLTLEANYYQTFKLGKVFWILFGLYLLAFIFLTAEIMIFFFRTPRKF